MRCAGRRWIASNAWWCFCVCWLCVVLSVCVRGVCLGVLVFFVENVVHFDGHPTHIACMQQPHIYSHCCLIQQPHICSSRSCSVFSQGTDFHKDMDAAANRLTPQHNYRLTAEEMAGRHFGELSCREFRDSVLKSLPHSWTRRSDTRIVARQFVRNTVANRKAAAAAAKVEREPRNAVARAVARVARAAGRGGGGERRLQAAQAHR